MLNPQIVKYQYYYYYCIREALEQDAIKVCFKVEASSGRVRHSYGRCSYYVSTSYWLFMFVLEYSVSDTAPCFFLFKTTTAVAG